MQTTDKIAPQKMPTTSTAKKLIDQYQQLKSQRTNFESYWQSLHDYFYIESQDINREYYPGTELNANWLYDSTTLETGDVLAAGFMNYLTPPTSKWFALRAKDQKLMANKKIARYLDDVTDQVNYTLNKSNFYNQIISTYKSSGVYGTSIMLEEEDLEDDARFYTIPLRQVCIVEDGRGRVKEYFIEFEYTALQAASRWGIENLSQIMREEINQGDRNPDKKHKFILHIATRHRRDINKVDKANLPIAAEWIDVSDQKIIEESGYNEFPAFCHRFDKRPFIAWGYSPAMKALPFARILNAAAKTNLRSMMKHTDPPIAVPDNAFIMPFNGNPRSVNYYNKNKMDAKDIFAFGNYGNMQVGMTAIEYYSAQIKSLMYNDVFLAFDAITKQMNNPEIAERINEKMTLLGPAVGRYISEIFNPIVVRTIGILHRLGKLPQPPEEFMQNPEYEIDCISQLAQAQRRTELNGLLTGLTVVSQMATQIPEALDKINPDKVVDEAWIILGGAERVLRDDNEVAKIREARAKIQQQQLALDQVQKGVDALKGGAEVDLNEARAEAEKQKL